MTKLKSFPFLLLCIFSRISYRFCFFLEFFFFLLRVNVCSIFFPCDSVSLTTCGVTFYVAVLYFCIRWRSRLSDIEEPEHHKYWCLVQDYTQEKVCCLFLQMDFIACSVYSVCFTFFSNKVERDSVGGLHPIVLWMHHCSVEFKVNLALSTFSPFDFIYCYQRVVSLYWFFFSLHSLIFEC